MVYWLRNILNISNTKVIPLLKFVVKVKIKNGLKRYKKRKFYICKIINWNRLNRNNFIRKFFCILLLAIFALSNTPTKYLHAIFANHKDFVSKTLTYSNSAQINAAGINCHCETNVVIAPYTMQSGLAINAPLPVFFGYTVSEIQETIFSFPLSFGLRGPPSIA